jgi:hypothetical protein
LIEVVIVVSIEVVPVHILDVQHCAGAVDLLSRALKSARRGGVRANGYPD